MGPCFGDNSFKSIFILIISCQNLECKVHSLIRSFLLNSKYNFKKIKRYDEVILTLSGKVSNRVDLSINFY